MTKEQKLERINQISEAILELKLTGDAVKTKLTIQELNDLTLQANAL